MATDMLWPGSTHEPSWTLTATVTAAGSGPSSTILGGRSARLRCGRWVVVSHVLVEDLLKVASTSDQHPVQAFLPDCPHPPHSHNAWSNNRDARTEVNPALARTTRRRSIRPRPACIPEQGRCVHPHLWCHSTSSAFNMPWSASMGIIAYRSMRCPGRCDLVRAGCRSRFRGKLGQRLKGRTGYGTARPATCPGGGLPTRSRRGSRCRRRTAGSRRRMSLACLRSPAPAHGSAVLRQTILG